jgi:hypothetical protein
MSPPVLTFHDFDEHIIAALKQAITEERLRYGEDLTMPVVIAKTVMQLRRELPLASDGLMRRVILLWRQASGEG